MILFVDPAQANEGRTTAALDAIRSQLADMKVDLRIERAAGVGDVRQRMEQVAQAPAGERKPMGAIWLDLARTENVYVFVADSGGLRTLVRRIVVSPGAEGAALEEVGVVVRSTVGALLEGRSISLVSAPPPPPPPPVDFAPQEPVEAAPANAPSSVHTLTRPAPLVPADRSGDIIRPPSRGTRDARFRASLGYVGSAFVSPFSWASGLSLWARYTTGSGVYGGLGYDVFPTTSQPATAGSASVVLELTQHPVRAFVGYEALPRAWCRVDAEVGFVADVATRSTSSPSGIVADAGSAARFIGSLSAGARAALRPVAPIWLALGGGADIGLDHFDYVITTAGGLPQNLSVQPQPVRPRLEASAIVDF
jgi:hypothetical protein